MCEGIFYRYSRRFCWLPKLGNVRVDIRSICRLAAEKGGDMKNNEAGISELEETMLLVSVTMVVFNGALRTLLDSRHCHQLPLPLLLPPLLLAGFWYLSKLFLADFGICPYKNSTRLQSTRARSDSCGSVACSLQHTRHIGCEYTRFGTRKRTAIQDICCFHVMIV